MSVHDIETILSKEFEIPEKIKISKKKLINVFLNCLEIIQRSENPTQEVNKVVEKLIGT